MIFNRLDPGMRRLSESASSRPPRADSTAFFYVNGAGNSFPHAMETSLDVGALLRSNERYSDRGEVVVRLMYNRNDDAQRGRNVAEQLICLNGLEPGLANLLNYIACRGMTVGQALHSLVADLRELGRLLGSPTLPTTLAVSKDIAEFADSLFRYREAGRNVVILPHSEGNLITQRALEQLQTDKTLKPNGSPTCIAIAPLASPTTHFAPIDARYIKPVQLNGDIVLLADLVHPAAEAFPATLNRLDDALTARRSGLRTFAIWNQLIDGVVMHSMQSYLAELGGRALVLDAANAAYEACAVGDVTISWSAASPDEPLLVGSTRQFAAFAFNGAGDQVTGRPTFWMAQQGVTVTSGGLATAIDPFGGFVSARVGARTGDQHVPTRSTPPRITVFTCTKGGVSHGPFTQNTRYEAHGEAAPTVPHATIVGVQFELELRKPGQLNSWTSMNGTSRNDALIEWQLTTPFREGPVIEGQLEPTGACRVVAFDSFGKSVTQLGSF